LETPSALSPPQEAGFTLKLNASTMEFPLLETSWVMCPQYAAEFSNKKFGKIFFLSAID